MLSLSESNMSADAMKKEQENFWRVLRIMWDDVPTRLCALFKQKFRTRFRESWKDEKEGKAAQKTFIEQIKTNSSVDQQTIRKIEKGDTKCFDCTALFMCLLYSGTEIMKPTRQEKAYPYRDSERVDELRVMRNTVAHAKTTKTMSVSTFNNNITSLTDIYKQLHWDTTEMLQLAQKPVVTEECNRLKKLLDDEMERFRALDLIVQDHAQKLKTLSGKDSKIYNKHFGNCFSYEQHTVFSNWSLQYKVDVSKWNGDFIISSLLLIRHINNIFT